MVANVRGGQWQKHIDDECNNNLIQQDMMSKDQYMEYEASRQSRYNANQIR